MPKIHIFILFVFLANTFGPFPQAQAQLVLPKAGARIGLSPDFQPPILKGIVIHPENPLAMDFLIHKGENPLNQGQKQQEYKKLIKYFLASLTIPEKDLWVNLSPYEKQRIIPGDFAQTEMGRDLLSQDYMLKQITASLIYPEDEFGKKFWKRIYEEAQQKFGTTNIPVNTFNKVWIIPNEATVYEHENTVLIVHSKMKVMLEEDYLALNKHQRQPGDMFQSEQQNVSPSTLPSELGLNMKAPQGANRTPNDTHTLGSQIIREIVLPALEKEVNEGKNFALLRQINEALILATWYKKALKESLLGQVYVDKAKVKGVNQPDTSSNQKIYEQYLHAFKKGVFNYIKEDVDPNTNAIIPRKYFSGGYAAADPAQGSSLDKALAVENDKTLSADPAAMAGARNFDQAMINGQIDEANVNLISSLDTSKPNATINAEELKKLLVGFVIDGKTNGIRYEISYGDQTDIPSNSVDFNIIKNEIRIGRIIFRFEKGIFITLNSIIIFRQDDRNQGILTAILKRINAIVPIGSKIKADKLANDPTLIQIAEKIIAQGKNQPTGSYDEMMLNRSESKKIISTKNTESIINHMLTPNVAIRYLTRAYNLVDLRQFITQYSMIEGDLDKKSEEDLDTMFKDTIVGRSFKQAGFQYIHLEMEPQTEDYWIHIVAEKAAASPAMMTANQQWTQRFMQALNELDIEAAESILQKEVPVTDPKRYAAQVQLDNAKPKAEAKKRREVAASGWGTKFQDRIEKSDIEGARAVLESVRRYISPSDLQTAEIKLKTLAMKINQAMVVDRGLGTTDAAMKSHDDKVDQAALANPFNPGGIDLNSANMDLQIKRDGRGVPLPLKFQDMEKLKNIKGFVPVIIKITPLTSMPFLNQLQKKFSP